MAKGILTRRFVNVSKSELKQAVIKMCDELGISASADNYSLFNAVDQEHDKAIAFVKTIEETTKKNK